MFVQECLMLHAFLLSYYWRTCLQALIAINLHNAMQYTALGEGSLTALPG